jgi:DNA-directed RNA polymerase subunit RPC12/RpoP
MNSYICYICDKEFQLAKSAISGDAKCIFCNKEFIELIKEADVDSQGNEFLSCKSEEDVVGSSLVEEEKKGDDDDDWSSEEE